VGDRAGPARVPDEFEVLLWRALAVFRASSLVYAVVVFLAEPRDYAHPLATAGVLGGMVAWTQFTIEAYARPRARRWWLLLADLAVATGCMLVSVWAVGETALANNTPVIPVTWMANPVLAWAVARGRRWGIVAALVVGASDTLVRGGPTQPSMTGTVIMATAALATGYLARLAVDVQGRLRRAAEADAATRERERLARGIHDSVLQVLALVRRRGAELGGEAAELGELAGEQEAALRALVSSKPGDGPQYPDVPADLRVVLGGFATATVSLVAPATPVLLDRRTAEGLAAAVRATLDNVRRHGAGAHAWVLIEEELGAVTVTVRDNGPGFAPGVLEQAERDGRLGVAQSIRGRVRELGGTATITSAPGQGTEVELRIP
jgi:signal transduction histidine kinase